MESRDTVIDRLDAYIARVASQYAPDRRYLAFLRIAFGIWVVVFPVDASWIDRVPPEFFHPRPGFFYFLSGPPSHYVLLAMMWAVAILGIVLTLGIFTGPTSVALALTLIINSGIAYSFSKVDHFVLFEITPIFLAAAGWGRIWSVDSYLRRRRGSRIEPGARGMPVLLFAMTIGWAMLTAAAPKVAGGWLDPSRYASRGYLARDIFQNEKLGPFGPMAMELHNGAFWKLLDYTTLLAEGGLIVVVLFPMVFRAWLALLACFHVGVYLTLGISFLDFVLVYAVFFSPVFMWCIAKGGSFVRRHAPDPVPA